ncbi:MAG: tetratricopeptide repeat protein [Armatimonadetes bacterium]|nr:tetratricopeptide repeat protein [Armatimonadota bacterium]
MEMDLDLTTLEGRKRQGELILQAIKDAGLSVEQVAKDIGCSRALLYQYIAGTTLAQPDKLTLIARRTGKPLAFFYGAEFVQPESLQAEREMLRREQLELERRQAEERTRQLREKIDSLFLLVEAQTSPPNMKAAISTCEQIILVARALGDEGAEARALFTLGNLRLLTGDLDGAVSALRQAQGLFERQGNTPYALACRQSIGRALLLMGHPEEAKAQFEQVAQSENWRNRWEATVALAAVAEWMGDFMAAMKHLDNAEELSNQSPTERDAQTVRMFIAANRANVYLACGDFVEGEKLAQTALKIAEQLGDRDQQLEALLTVAVCQRFQGKWSDAWENAERAKLLASFADDVERTTIAETVLANIAAVVGDFATAKSLGKNALTNALKLRSRRAELWAHKALAETYLREESADDAHYHAQVAIEISESMRNLTEFAHALSLRAWSKFLLGKLDEALSDAERAFSISDEKGMDHVAALAMFLKAQIAKAKNEKRAIEWLKTSERIAREVNDADLIYRCSVLKGQWSFEIGDLGRALDELMKANELLTKWRSEWREAGHDDTWLEDPLRFKASLTLAQCIARKEGKTAADKFVDELGWLPLKEDWERKAETLKSPEPKRKKTKRL